MAFKSHFALLSLAYRILEYIIQGNLRGKICSLIDWICERKLPAHLFRKSFKPFTRTMKWGKPSLRSTLKIRRKNGREMVPLYIWTIGNSNRHANKDEIELIYGEECENPNSHNGDYSDEINSFVKSTLRKNAPEFVPSNEWVFGNTNKDSDSDEITISLKSALRKSAPEFVPGMKWVVGNSNSDDNSEEISITLKSTLRKNAPDFVPGKEWAVGNSTKDDDSDKVCCLCEEPVKRTLFGMLSHCNHVFCVECLRGWRCAPGREHMLKRYC
ncbi:hypothetical protein CAPTEDRAFT_191805 [Capitella teleta]|uniref:RING-type domain-containing protein n=1 Tax=Capitella teleta TaxID=283909 RepID=R7VJD0_CAPTE|nr:hypothetical protein CAPTEDRAFT_191805 [Capitella teleta]|eukprot:ELU16461.1 hypothetical protein CAPTEDRAFT_191805 [Capitella teleta]